MAAVSTDSIATAYSAVRTTGALQSGETVGIIGLGGLGLSGLRTAVLRGGVVYGVDVNPSAFDAARERGAVECFTDIKALAALKPDLVLDFAGTGATTEGALSIVKKGGRVVVVGMMNDSARVNTHRLILGRQTLRGSFGRTAQDMAEVLDLLATDELRPVLTTVALGELNEAYGRLDRGSVVGRLVTFPWR
jgi:propanol-preferring alcohol dehydrogenase